jgi:hypothetical protein
VVGLTEDGEDIDAFGIDGGVLYFSTAGNIAPGPEGGTVPGTADNSDVYSWNGATLARVLDLSTIGVPGAANVDALTVKGGVYYLSFDTDVTIGGVLYQDEDIVAYTPATGWSLYWDATAAGMTAANQDLDAIQVP